MRFIMIASLVLVTALSALAQQSLSLATLPNGDSYIAQKIVVTLKYQSPELTVDRTVFGIAQSGVSSIDNLCREIGVTRIQPFYSGRLSKPALIREISRMYVFTLHDGLDASVYLEDFERDPNIEFAELYTIPRPFYIPNDPLLDDQWFLERTDAYGGWDIIRGDSTRIAVIGIVDTGVYWTHPDLAANIWINAAEDINHNGIFDDPDNNGVDDDTNGYIDDVVGWDLGVGDNNPAEMQPTHGTPVAGAASEVADNNLLGAGIGFSARIMCVKGANNQNQLTAVYQGLIYAAENGAHILNCSWGSMTYHQNEQLIMNSIHEVGILIVAAAGGGGDTIRSYPAGYENVMAVTATDQFDHLMPFAGHGIWIDVCAPGDNIWSTWAENSFINLSGTSFSAPMVCGLAALIKSWNPGFSAFEIESLIEDGADTIDHLNPNYRGMLGAGRINCANWLPTAVEDMPATPEQFIMIQNYPNPFNSNAVIRYSLPKPSFVTLDIYDILGQRVSTLVSSFQDAGAHEVFWNAGTMSSGPYYYRIKAGDFVARKKMTLAK
jgi:subtilisin family serine protease